jgi:VWFA-related protein
MAQQTVRSFVSQIRSTDEVTIPQINAGREAVRDYTTDERKLEHALSGISSNNKSPLVDVIAGEIKSTKAKRLDQRRITIVIADGLSLSGIANDREAAYALLREETPICLIILDDGPYTAHPAVQSRVRRTRYLLTWLADVSGRLALIVKSEDEISAAAEQIIERLKNQYTVGYYAINDIFDGSFRYIRVTVTPKDNRKVKVFAPSGYYAVDPETIREEKTNDK